MPWYQKAPIDPVPVPVLGPDLMDIRRIEDMKIHMTRLGKASTAAVGLEEGSGSGRKQTSGPPLFRKALSITFLKDGYPWMIEMVTRAIL